MKAKRVGMLLLILVSVMIAGFVIGGTKNGFEIKEVRASPGGENVLYVGGSGPNNYTKIQDAIDNATNGDTIFVYNGIYYENIWLSGKNIALVGEDKNETIIDGSGSTAIAVYDYVNISHFTIRNADVGLFIDWLWSGGLVNDCIIINCSTTGIRAYDVSNLTILNCKIRNGEYGYSGSRNFNTVIKNCVINDNDYGVDITRGYNVKIMNSNISNSPCGMELSKCYDIIIDQCHIYHNQRAIDLSSTEYSIIRNNTIDSGSRGITLYSSHYNLIQNNTIKDFWRGIEADGDSVYNRIYNNNFESNINHAYDEGSNIWNNGYTLGGNYWDDYTGSDSYYGINQNLTGSDGIGDIPYNILGGSNIDKYPLIQKCTTIEIIPIYVDDDFTNSTPGWQYDHFDKIQDGIDAVAWDGSLFVYDGIYYENVEIRKTIHMIGKDKNDTIIDGDHHDTVAVYYGDGFSISGFTIRNGENFSVGIWVGKAKDIRIFNNIIENNAIGIWLNSCDNPAIYNNVIRNNTEYNWGIGISVEEESTKARIFKNLIYDNHRSGISIDCEDSVVLNNEFVNDELTIWYTLNNTVLHNSFKNSSLIIEGCEEITIINNSIENGGIYLSSSNDTVIEDNALDGANIEMDGGSNNMILSNTISNIGEGIVLRFSKNTLVTENIIWSNVAGIIMWSINTTISHNCILNNDLGIVSPYIEPAYWEGNNQIKYNNIFNNTYDGINLSMVGENSIIGNNIDGNGRYGICLFINTLNNTIMCNNITNNGVYGLYIKSYWYSPFWSTPKSLNNEIYHNNFIGNTQQAYDENRSYYDKGFPFGGNYWSDYTGTDSNGDMLGDVPYNIRGGSNRDRLPLMDPYGEIPPVASFVYSPQDCSVAQVITFNGALSYDIDGDIVSYYWDFGDSINASGDIIYHQYSTYGKYNVTLIVADDDGRTDSIMKQINILAIQLSTVYVDDDFNASTPGWQYDHFDKIQDGIDAVAEGGTVYVFNGTYYENVVVNKTIDLVGEDMNTTIIDGGGVGDVIYISADWVNISNLTVTNSGDRYEEAYRDAGIDLVSDHNTLFNINASNNNRFGVSIYYASYNTISNCLVSNNYGVGIPFIGGVYNNITHCVISNNSIHGEGGIDLSVTSYNRISHCLITKNHGIGGVYIDSGHEVADNNIIEYNTIRDNFALAGIYIGMSPNIEHNNKVHHNNFINNTQNAYDDADNIWDNGYPSGGNYWDDYTGSDNFHGSNQDIPGSDGIGDTPYYIPGGSNVDRYPLMYPWNWTAQPSIVYVNDDFNSSTPGWQYDHFNVIQDGIDAVAENGTVYVYNGTYYENVVVNKTINLIGEDKNGTILIEGSPHGNVIYVTTNYVNISNFTLKGAYYSGLFLNYSNNNTISNCNVRGNGNGIQIEHSCNNTIFKCNISDNWYGIWLSQSSNYNTIYDCDVYDCGQVSIYLGFYSSNNSIRNCTVHSTRQYSSDSSCIRLIVGSDNNSIKNCILSNGWTGIELWSSRNNKIFNNTLIDNGMYMKGNYLPQYFHTIENNTVNGKPLLYFKNKKNTVLEEVGVGQIILVNCTNFEIKNITIENTIVGMLVSYCHNFNISTCNIYSSFWNGIELWGSSNYTIYGCKFISNDRCGIYVIQSNNSIISSCDIYTNDTLDEFGFVLGYSRNFIIFNCSILGFQEAGLALAYSWNNTIFECNILDNSLGIWSYYSNNNTINNCNILNNWDGIMLKPLSNNNIILDCNISENAVGVVTEAWSNDNKIYNCTIVSNNYYGMYMSWSNYNLIYNNYFKNMNNTYDNGTNIWNISKTPGTNIIGGPYLGGNYWSDYTGADTDGDGLGDTNLPHNSSGGISNGGDLLPLSNPNYGPVADFSYSPSSPTKEDVIHFNDLSTDSDGSIVNWTWNFGDGTISYQQNPTHRYSNDGMYTVTLTVKDDDGATDTISKRIDVYTPTRDKTPPTTNIFIKGNKGENDWYIDNIIIGLTAYDAGSGVAYTKYRIDDGNWHYYESAIHILQEGRHVVEYYSVDYAGNKESAKSFEFALDKTAPDVKVLYPNGGETISGKIFIEWMAVDEVSMCQFINIWVSSDGGNTWGIIAYGINNTGEYKWNTVAQDDGRNYLIKVVAVDEAGHMGSDISDSLFSIKQFIPPPNIVITKPKQGYLYVRNREIMPLQSDKTVVIGKITIGVSASSVKSIEKVEFYVDDELMKTIEQESQLVTGEWTWNKLALGRYTIKAVAYDNAGNMATDEQEVWIFNL